VLVLALESATETAGVALADEAGLISSATTSRGRRHAESMAPSVEFVCRRAGISLRDIDGICVDVGPGLFTGLRVGIATAKALGFALGLRVAVASSLEVLARALGDTESSLWQGAVSERLVVPVVDAKRGEVFSSRYRSIARGKGAARPVEESLGLLGDSVEAFGEEVLSTPEDLVSSLSQIGEPFVLGGDGAFRYEEMLTAVPGALLAPGAPAGPPVEVLAQIGLARLRAGLGVDAAEVAPRYLREADVRINWEQRPSSSERSRTVI